ncbi:Hypothetical protein PHPALM_17429 [Phytophthora palmivora]|uniref:PiggyBac transposable element-derived protein domain-containing protein n=1 Tax=Phytophthora palmivora TaxID=4796 RepID=A0A2P4XMC4_9STRA|nr:Hypothetical protein PHPALM_17429 [Phytophthora palmivora]
MHIIGTVRLNLVDKWNKPAVEASVQRMVDAERGGWELPEYRPRLTIAERAGYIIFKDRKVVIIYSNDLRAIPSSRTLSRYSDEAVAASHGLYPIQRSPNDRVLPRKTFTIPTVIASYMNAVDRADPLRSTNPTRRREKRLDMTLFTWLLDMAAINAFALLKRIAEGHPTLRIADTSTRSEKAIRWQQVRRNKKRQCEALDDVVRADASLHIITPNSTTHGNGKLKCYLCSLRRINKKAQFGYTTCERGFHVACFSAFHYQDVFKARSSALRGALEAVCRATTGEPVAFTRNRTNRSITSVDALKLPTA